jgi:hypothetical protein
MNWSARQGDTTFDSLEDLYLFTRDRASKSQSEIVPPTKIKVVEDDGRLGLGTPRTQYMFGTPKLNAWSLQQLCARAEVPVRYAKKIDPIFAATNLNYGLRCLSNQRKEINLYYTPTEVRAATSGTYGRVWDHEVIDLIQDTINASGTNWVPAQVENAPPTVYAGDRDFWVFLIDQDNPVNMYNPTRGHYENLYRGVIFGNSEVGSRRLFGWEFLFRSLCSNNMIYMSNMSQKRFHITHTVNAPNRFIEEGPQIFSEFLNAPSEISTGSLRRAMNDKVADDEKEAITWLRSNVSTGNGVSISTKQAKRVIERATAEEGDYRTRWCLIQGGTSLAKEIPNADVRSQQEYMFTKLLRAA